MTLTLALDIGGTKIAAALVDADARLVHRAQLPTPDGDAETVWEVVDKLLGEAMRTADGAATGVGVASAGPIDLPNGTVSPINIAEWQHFPIVERVVAATRLPVRLGGDGLCMALGEQWCGAGRGAQFLLGMVVSTGVGGGLVLDAAVPAARTRGTPVGVDDDMADVPVVTAGTVPTPRRWARQRLKETMWRSRHFTAALERWRP